MKLVVKNMTCHRSKIEVCDLLTKLGLHPAKVEIGEVIINDLKLSVRKHRAVEEILRRNGYALVTDREQALVEKIKYLIIEMVYYSEEFPRIKYSEYLSSRMGMNYTNLSRLFSKHKQTTIRRFIIAHKIERVKQLLLYDELTLSQISWKLNYSSTAHLSAQFKKVTGCTASAFKKRRIKKLTPPSDLDCK